MKPKERPILENIVKDDTLEIESFQNKTLRPIIKMQHEILIACFNNYLEDKKIKLPIFIGVLINFRAKKKIKKG